MKRERPISGKAVDNMKKKPIILITGYLGSGKTTLMQKLLEQEQRRIALIVNDKRQR